MDFIRNNRKRIRDMSTFKIDFFELSFLAEACIPPVPIARGVFWKRLINEIYYDLTDNERERLFGWITRNHNFSLDNEDCQWFYARFNPKNQFNVFYNGVELYNESFLKDGKYYTNMDRYIDAQYIKSVVRKHDSLVLDKP